MFDTKTKLVRQCSKAVDFSLDMDNYHCCHDIYCSVDGVCPVIAMKR